MENDLFKVFLCHAWQWLCLVSHGAYSKNRISCCSHSTLDYCYDCHGTTKIFYYDTYIVFPQASNTWHDKSLSYDTHLRKQCLIDDLFTDSFILIWTIDGLIFKLSVFARSHQLLTSRKRREAGWQSRSLNKPTVPSWACLVTIPSVCWLGSQEIILFTNIDIVVFTWERGQSGAGAILFLKRPRHFVSCDRLVINATKDRKWFRFN